VPLAIALIRSNSGAGGGMGSGQALHQLGVALLGLLEHVEADPGAGAIFGDHGLGAPGAVGIGVEVVARLDGVVDAGEVDPSGGRLGRCGCRRGGVLGWRLLPGLACPAGDDEGQEQRGTQDLHGRAPVEGGRHHSRGGGRRGVQEVTGVRIRRGRAALGFHAFRTTKAEARLSAGFQNKGAGSPLSRG